MNPANVPNLINASFYNKFFVWPVINVLIALYVFFVMLSIPGPLGWAIIALTVIVRIILHPLTKKQMESAKKMQELKPKIDALQKKYKDDKTKLQQAQMDLYKKEGINPAAGCLPLLIQMPIIFALFSAFRGVLLSGSPEQAVDIINQVVYFDWLHIESLDIWWLGINLAYLPSAWQEIGWGYLAIPAIIGGLQLVQMRQMAPKKTDTKALTKKSDEPDIAADMQKSMQFVFPIMIGFFAYSLPVGLSLYWGAQSVLMIYAMRNRDETTQSKSN